MEKRLRHGKGKMIYQNGEKYVGSWYKDRKHGFGELFFMETEETEDTISTEFDEEEGKGSDEKTISPTKNYNMAKYEGDFVMDTFHDLQDYLSGDGFTDMLASVMIFIEAIPGRLVDLGETLFDGVMSAFSAIGGFLLDAGGDIIDFAKVKFLEFKVAIFELLNNLSGGFLGNKGLEESQEALANELKQQREAKIKEDRERAAARAKAEEERET